MRERVRVTPLGRWVDPAVVFAAVCGDADDAFWLDSGPGATAGRSYLGRAAEIVTDFPDGVLAFLRGLDLDADTTDAPPGFALGWIGWLGYEVRGETLDVPVPAGERHPRAAWSRVDRAVAFDHARREVLLLSLGDVHAWRDEVLVALAARPSLETPASSGLRKPALAARSRTPAHWAHTDDAYVAMIAACQDAIRAGDAYQLCLTTAAELGGSFDPVSVYTALRASSPTHHGALLRAGATSLLSASPEQFLDVSPAGEVTTRPIKGTRARGATEAVDRRLRQELTASDKERAENVMIVDLMRNDLARVAEVGSVEVTSLLAVESYAQVHQLVSTVRGRLRHGLTAVDAIEACFPAGSMTGAPKRSAVAILQRLEQRPRGVYSGAFGYLGLDGALDLAMVIRSIVLDARGATVGAGGGITALSVPADELAEVKLKAAALLEVLGASG
ncbi:MAG TPA: anthranilate synthase component I family protein [Rhodoglobus sp.]|nr:anthranilate synthase component I family protein [Rhodoglobus sp.]